MFIELTGVFYSVNTVIAVWQRKERRKEWLNI